jgi:hypothetical protein
MRYLVTNTRPDTGTSLLLAELTPAQQGQLEAFLQSGCTPITALYRVGDMYGSKSPTGALLSDAVTMADAPHCALDLGNGDTPHCALDLGNGEVLRVWRGLVGSQRCVVMQCDNPLCSGDPYLYATEARAAAELRRCWGYSNRD